MARSGSWRNSESRCLESGAAAVSATLRPARDAAPRGTAASNAAFRGDVCRWLRATGLAWLLCALGALCASARAESPETLDAFVERDDSALLILGLHAANLPLHDGILAYAQDDTVLVPLLALCDALGIPVMGSPAQGHAEGWFRDEGRRFLLDIGQRRLYVDGEARETDWRRIERHAEDLYVPLDAFSDWFGLKLQAQLQHSRLWLEDAQALPAQQRRERLARWRERERNLPVATEQGRVQRVSPHLLDWPAVDLSLAATADPARTALRANLLAAGDLFGTEALLSVSWRSDEVEDGGTRHRLRLQRSGSDAHAPDWSFGDVQSPTIPLLVNASEGLGVQVGTLDDGAEGDAFTTEIRGEALEGWDAELYRNQELLALITVGGDNRYVFRDVPLQSGLNLFRVALYGPQGQRRERWHRVNLGGALLRPGQRRWRAFALLPDRGVFGRADEARIANDVGAGDAMAGLGYRWALSRHATASVDAFTASLADGERRVYGSARIQGGVGQWWLEGQWLEESTGGSALRLVAQRSGTRADGGLDYQRFDDFLSPDTARGGERPLESLRGRWSLRVLPKTPITLEAERLRTQREAGLTHARDTLRMRVSRRIANTNVALSADTVRESLRARTTSAGMLLSYRGRAIELSAQLGREFAPRAGLRQATATAQWALNDRLRLRAQFARTIAARDPNRIELGLSWRAKRWSLQLGASSTGRDDYRVDATLFTSLQRGAQGWHADARAASAAASAEVEVFLDKNLNDRFDTGDVPLTDVAVRVAATGTTLRTGPDGRAFFTHLPAHATTHFRLLEDSLEQPFWLPRAPVVSLRAHAGARVRVQFAVVPSVEIDGTVFLRTDTGRKPAANVALELRDAGGAVVRETRTAFDGAYLLDRLQPGDYTLRVSAEQTRRLALEDTAPRSLSLGDGRETATLDWVLTPQPAP
jgi:Carboxypeptidase regulatory-like domain